MRSSMTAPGCRRTTVSNIRPDWQPAPSRLPAPRRRLAAARAARARLQHLHGAEPHAWTAAGLRILQPAGRALGRADGRDARCQRRAGVDGRLGPVCACRRERVHARRTRPTWRSRFRSPTCAAPRPARRVQVRRAVGLRRGSCCALTVSTRITDRSNVPPGPNGVPGTGNTHFPIPSRLHRDREQLDRVDMRRLHDRRCADARRGDRGRAVQSGNWAGSRFATPVRMGPASRDPRAHRTAETVTRRCS